MSFLEDNYSKIFKKYSDDELASECNSFIHGNGRLSRFLKHYFSELIFESSTLGGKYVSPIEALKDDNYINEVIKYVKSKPNVYASHGSELEQVLTYFQVGGSNKGRQVANFPPRVARDIYTKYYKNTKHPINCLDTSSGFGSRMSAVLLSGNNYFSTDPNSKLHTKLIECAKWMYTHGFISKSRICDLKCHGSEVFIPEWEGIMDVSFTSPPYFNLEKYSDDESASTKNYNNYDLWLEEFVKPTIANTYRYLKPGGYAMINIKNLGSGSKKPLFDDWKRLFNEHGGFDALEDFEMKQTCESCMGVYNKDNFNLGDSYSQAKEPVMCFRKKSDALITNNTYHISTVSETFRDVGQLHKFTKSKKLF